jgi:ABC-type methionine transport system ATPase subunit
MPPDGEVGEGRKLGGLLVETVAAGSSRLVVVGVGLNVLPMVLDRSQSASGFACLQEINPQASAPAVMAQVAAPLVDALQRFDLDDKLFERVDRLSGGERQRVGLARALLAPASLWLVDEPLSALDPTRAQQALATLLQQARERGVTLVATLHQVDAALAHFPRIVGLREGVLVFDLPAAEVDRDLLARLYGQHEFELQADATALTEEQPPQPTAPVVMHCR